MVKEYRQTTAPLDKRLQGTQGAGGKSFGFWAAGFAKGIIVVVAGSGVVRQKTRSTARHSAPAMIRYKPIPRKNARHMFRLPVLAMPRIACSGTRIRKEVSGSS
jgi:hypothetical protein